jgi:uncharacterized protein (UPF0332 family)
MKVNDWDECVEFGISLEVSPDKAKVKSLIDTSSGRNDFLKTNKITESNANYIFEGYYSSVLELLHALILLKGYKISNHVCLGYYLRDVLKKGKIFKLFDDCRYKRNSLLYYGRKMDYETAKEAIENTKILIEKLMKEIK